MNSVNAVWLCALVGLVAGCSKGMLSYDRHGPPGSLGPEDAITVILIPESPRITPGAAEQSVAFNEKSARSLENQAADCIRDALKLTHPTIPIVPADQFRQLAFPGLSPPGTPTQGWRSLEESFSRPHISAARRPAWRAVSDTRDGHGG
jgi:hypothetical protein